MSKGRKFLVILLFIGIWGCAAVVEPGPGLCEESDSLCSSQADRWEQTIQNLRRELSEYESIKGTPVERVVGRPVVNLSSSKPIAAQVSEALGVKEDILKGKRKSCRTLLSLERESFDKYLECIEDATGKKQRRKIRRLKKDRERLLDRVRVAIAEVREVRGSGDYAQYYNNSWGGQNAYGGRAYNYWGNNQQMYRQYWGR